MLNTKRGQ